MEQSSASVSRSSSLRKRALEERKSIDMEVESLPTKHERAPSEADMDVSSSPARFSTTTTSGSNTVLDEIEAHFQRSLAQAKPLHNSVRPPSTIPTCSHTHSTPPHPHRPLVVMNSPPLFEKHPKVTASPPTTHTLSHSTDHDSHQIVVTLNNHAVSTLNNSKQSPSPKAHLANGVHTHIPVKPAPKTGSPTLVAAPTGPGFVTIPKTGSPGFVTPQSLPKPIGSPVSTTMQTLPMLTIPPGGLVNSDPGVKNISGGTVLSPVLTPQLVQLQQIITQQNLALIQEQQKRQQLANTRQRNDSLSNANPTQSAVPNLIQIPSTASSPKGFEIIDLTKAGQRSSPGQSSPKLISAQPNVVLVQNDGATVAKGTGAVGGALRVVNPSSVPVQPQNRVVNKANSTLVTATMTQPTPAVSTTMLTSPQIVGGQGISPMVIPMIDPMTSQIVTGGNQVVFLSAPPTVPVVRQQPLILVNPNDLSTMQQVPSGIPPGVNLLSPGYATIPNPSGGAGLILLSPGPNSMPPLINMTPSSGVPSPNVATPQLNGSPTKLKNIPPPLKTAQKPKVPPLEPVNIRHTSLGSISPGDEESDDVMMTPASVEDHFAKALGDQWPKLQAGTDFRNSIPRSVQAAQT